MARCSSMVATRVMFTNTSPSAMSRVALVPYPLPLTNTSSGSKLEPVERSLGKGAKFRREGPEWAGSLALDTAAPAALKAPMGR
jgi:hypothetical protein